MDTKDRFMSYIDIPDECWEWQGKINYLGYGRFKIGRKAYASHRIAYELFVDDIPVGMELDHLCRNRACVNPNHLEPVSHLENMARAFAYQHLGKGHKPVWKTLKQGRICAECRRISRQKNGNWKKVL